MAVSGSRRELDSPKDVVMHHQHPLQYAPPSHRRDRSIWAVYFWVVIAVSAWWAITIGGLMFYVELHLHHGWPSLPNWIANAFLIAVAGPVAIVAFVIVLGVKGKLPVLRIRKRKASELKYEPNVPSPGTPGEG